VLRLTGTTKQTFNVHSANVNGRPFIHTFLSFLITRFSVFFCSIPSFVLFLSCSVPSLVSVPSPVSVPFPVSDSVEDNS
jgi:hypothetical protein